MIRHAAADAATGIRPTSLPRGWIVCTSRPLPAWALMQLRTTSEVIIPATRCHKENISDHAPLRVSLSCKRLLPKHIRPIPKLLAKHPIFKQVLTGLEKDADLDNLEPFARWTQHKQIVRQASEIAARRCLSKVAKTNDEQLQAVMQASRTIWYDMPSMISKITKTLPSLKGVIHIDSHGHAAIIDHARFQAIVGSIVNKTITEENEFVNIGEGKKCCNRSRMLSRWAKMWVPFDKRLILHGTLLPEGSLAITASTKAGALAAHWGEVFKKKAIDERLARAVTRVFTEKLVLGNERIPCNDDYIYIYTYIYIYRYTIDI